MKNYRSIINILISSIFLLITIASCKSEKPIPQEEEHYQASFKFIDFGYGGGFAGTYNFYRLMDSGNLWKLENDSPVTRISQISTDQIKSVDRLKNDLIDSDFQSNMMGNMTYFLKIRQENTDLNFIWKEEADPVESKASILYEKLDQIRKESVND